MRNWTFAGAEAILRLRAAAQDGSYAQLWERQSGGFLDLEAKAAE